MIIMTVVIKFVVILITRTRNNFMFRNKRKFKKQIINLKTQARQRPNGEGKKK